MIEEGQLIIDRMPVPQVVMELIAVKLRVECTKPLKSLNCSVKRNVRRIKDQREKDYVHALAHKDFCLERVFFFLNVKRA